MESQNINKLIEQKEKLQKELAEVRRTIEEIECESFCSNYFSIRHSPIEMRNRWDMYPYELVIRIRDKNWVIARGKIESLTTILARLDVSIMEILIKLKGRASL